MDTTVLLSQALSNLLAAVVAQFAALNWPLIVSGAGIGEVISTRNYRKSGRKLPWAFPLILGAIFGIPQFMQTARPDNVFTFINGAVVSAATYSGLIVVVYLVSIKPFKALTTRLEGGKPGPASK
jgi:hypothetical protein